MNGQNLTKFCIHIIIDKIYVWIVKHHILANLQQSYDLDLRQNLVQPWTAELAALNQLKKKIFYLLENYLKMLFLR